jgi:hypothetical protein
MATTTPNYGWTVPTSTDLVKDGATAIETLGDAIDASMNTALGTKKAGMVLLNTTSFSGVANQAVSSIFTASYDNYRMLINITSNTADATIFLKLRSGTTDNSATSYNIGRATVDRGAVRGEVGQNDQTTGWNIGEVDLGVVGHYYGAGIDLHQPNLTRPTIINYLGHYIATNGSLIGSSGAGFHGVSSAFDGVNLIASSGNITGTIQIFGYNQ